MPLPARSRPTKEQAGYQFTGAQFRYAQATVYLRNASQYSASIGGLGQSVQFWGGGRVYVLGVSDTTTHEPVAARRWRCSTTPRTP